MPINIQGYDSQIRFRATRILWLATQAELALSSLQHSSWQLLRMWNYSSRVLYLCIGTQTTSEIRAYMADQSPLGATHSYLVLFAWLVHLHVRYRILPAL